MNKVDYRGQIEEIRHTYLKGGISYDDARASVETLLVEMNKKGAIVAKKFGKKFTKLTFGYIFR